MSMRSLRVGQVLVCVIAALVLTSATALGTTPPPPTATTGTASSIEAQSAVISATVNPEGAATEAYFQYGTSTSYGAESASAALPVGSKGVTVSEAISSLVANKTYHYRIVAVNANGTTTGLDATFKTTKIPLLLAITADPSPATYGGVVVVEGTLAGTDSGNQPVALQQNPFPYTAGFTQLGNTELTTSSGAYAFTIGSVLMNTEYRVVSLTTPSVISAVVDEGDAIAGSLSSHALGSHAHPRARFTGTVAPGIETDAKVAIEKLDGTVWKLVGGTLTSNSDHNGVATFSTVVHFRHAGFFRLYVQAVDGAHVSDTSAPIYVRGYPKG
jgi:hypothetical protein